MPQKALLAPRSRSSSNAPALARLVEVKRHYVMGRDVVHALQGVSLEFFPGQLVGIVGSSGSGKSTMMNILGCLDRPSSGEYLLGEVEVGGLSTEERAIVRNRLLGFIFQGFHLLPRTTALENTELPLVYRGVSRKERRRMAIEALVRVGLGERLQHTPSELSGGQQQRVAIARALVTKAPLILADEPTGNLDSVTTYEVLALLQELVRDEGRTVLVVTHEPEVARCTDRIITVADGLLRSDIWNPEVTDARAAAIAAAEARSQETSS